MLLFLEFIGTSELMIIAVVALIIFGPRKLPEIGRTLGRSLAEFKRASEDFKRTWEREVEIDRIERELRFDEEAGQAHSGLPAGDNADAPASTLVTADGQSPEDDTEGAQTIARAPSGGAASATAETFDEEAAGVTAERAGPSREQT